MNPGSSGPCDQVLLIAPLGRKLSAAHVGACGATASDSDGEDLPLLSPRQDRR